MSEKPKKRTKVGGKPAKSGITNRPSTIINQERFLKEYFACQFNITKACSNLGISRETVRKWRVEDQDFERTMNESTESLIDSAEQQLRQQVEKGNMDAIKFVLSRLGKNRGYAERVELSGENSGPIEIKVTTVIVDRND